MRSMLLGLIAVVVKISSLIMVILSLEKNILFGLVVSTGNIPLITNYTPKLLIG